MKKSITIIKKDRKVIGNVFKEHGALSDVLFMERQKDTIGKSGSSPTWGYVYYNDEEGKSQFKGVGLYKEYDYDFPKAAYGEKAWSILGKELIGDTVRVPFIDIVEVKPGYEGIISYRVMDNNKEDMIHIKDTLFNKFEREEIKGKKDILTVDELLECVKLQINNEENYIKIERDIVKVLLLDSITNNGDRHAFNWSLIRNKETGEYELAVFDHATSFIDMFEDRAYILGNGWAATYITVGEDKGRIDIGSSGEKVVEYIFNNYPEYFEEFYDKFDKKLPEILELIKQEKMQIDYRRLENKLREKKHFLKKLRNRGELEYE